MYSIKRQFGNQGEDFVVKDLETKGFKIITRNYLKKWGEIDIVALKDGELHFIEVKSVTYIPSSDFRPEDNMHYDKLKRLQRTCQSFLAQHMRQYHDTDWQIDLACVYLENESLKKIEYIENII